MSPIQQNDGLSPMPTLSGHEQRKVWDSIKARCDARQRVKRATRKQQLPHLSGWGGVVVRAVATEMRSAASCLFGPRSV